MKKRRNRPKAGPREPAATKRPKARPRKQATTQRSSPQLQAGVTHKRLYQELEVQKIELELQNEELRNARVLIESGLERYTEVFDFAPIGYATLDRDGTIRELNHAGAFLLGAERGRLLGQHFRSFVDIPAIGRFDMLLHGSFTGSAATSTEIELVREVIRFPAKLTAAVLRRREPMMLLAFEDITERRTKEIELAHTEAALREMNRRKDEFLAMLSHELRNPLAPIRSSVSALRLAEPGSNAAREAVEIIDRSAAHLTRLVDDLLDVTRITRGLIELKRAPMELGTLVRGTVADHRSAFEQRRIELTLRCEDNELWTFGDATRLVQVLSNLLGNAEKFTPAGGRVTVSLERVGNAAKLTVQDTGIGIAPEMIGELFRPFAQVQQALDRSRGGLGLGLVMVKSLVELHGGRVSIRSAGLGRGMEVAVSLPIEPSHAWQPERARAEGTIRRRILIIEDMRDTAHSLQQLLQLKGHEVSVAYDGVTGTHALAELRPDVVLCDLGLPDMDGFAFAMHVRSDPDLSSTYLVALSGYARTEDVERAKAAGFDLHLAKPASLDEIDRLLAGLPATVPPPTETNTLH